ncbi:hypothetical protein PISS_a1636 [Pseudoalteromonas issachenkonii]|uniref:Uncharacterized protein n=1 Tax=Pseudoalteromonas issachenkonii TaxID=152297 RepID=A0ABM6N2P8_9GAMM|nr:hypothetical protein PISS_a1636 [Pseudoalteromonas issachenkonii]
MNILAVPYLIKILGYKFQILKSHLGLKLKWLFYLIILNE